MTFTPGISTALLRSRRSSSGSEIVGESKYLGSGQTRTVVPDARCPPVPITLSFSVDVAAGEHDAMHLAVALHLDFQALRQRVGHGDADAVQAAREA